MRYAQQRGLQIDEFIQVEISSRKTTTERRIDELMDKLNKGDTLLVAELSRLGRNMFETLNIINALGEKGVSIIFVHQPELSTTGPHTKLLLVIYSYFAESERNFISIRTKQGLAAARAKGKQRGRPKGSRNKERKLDAYREQMRQYRAMKLPLASIRKIINNQREKEISYNACQYYVRHDEELCSLWLAAEGRGGEL